MNEKEMETVFEKLNDTNKNIMMLIAKGMEIAQNNEKKQRETKKLELSLK